MSIPIKPLRDGVVVKQKPEQKQTEGGIYLPDTAEKEKPQTGEILACGPGKRDQEGKYIPIDLSVGDVVLYNKYSGTNVTVSGEDYLVLREEDVMAVVD